MKVCVRRGNKPKGAGRQGVVKAQPLNERITYAHNVRISEKREFLSSKLSYEVKSRETGTPIERADFAEICEAMLYRDPL